MIENIVGLYNYWVVVFLMMTGFYIVIARGNLVKKIVGLNIFQISVFLLYISMGKVDGGTTPIMNVGHDEHGHPTIEHATDFRTGEEFTLYSNPLPSVLILTAIVVGVATTALALALIVRIHEAYGTIEEDEILPMDQEL